MIRFPEKGICRTALPTSLSFTPLIADVTEKALYLYLLRKKKGSKVGGRV